MEKPIGFNWRKRMKSICEMGDRIQLRKWNLKEVFYTSWFSPRRTLFEDSLKETSLPTRQHNTIFLSSLSQLSGSDSQKMISIIGEGWSCYHFTIAHSLLVFKQIVWKRLDNEHFSIFFRSTCRAGLVLGSKRVWTSFLETRIVKGEISMRCWSSGVCQRPSWGRAVPGEWRPPSF